MSKDKEKGILTFFFLLVVQFVFTLFLKITYFSFLIGMDLNDVQKPIKRSYRGMTRKCTIIKNRSKGIKLLIKYNHDGIFVRDASVCLTSYLSVLVRTMVPIRYRDWRDVPIQLKDKLWDAIDETYLYFKRLLIKYYYLLQDEDTNNIVIICRLLL